jgi:putative chitinase
MAASLDRAAFFACARKTPFPNALSQGQVSGMGAILDACPPDLGSQELAYCLATAFLETARTMLPIKEYGGDAYFKRMYDPLGDRPATAKTLGNTQPGDGAKFAGRGYVQLTGRANYRRATGELQNRGYLDRSLDLTVTPDMAMTPDLAAAIMFLGMTEGWFTGKKLEHYFGPGKLGDPVNARRIINGLDRAADVARYHDAFLKALKAAGHKPGGATAAIPVAPVEVAPLQPPVFAPAPRATAQPAPLPPPDRLGPTVQTGSFWASLKSLFKKAS